MTSTVTAVLIAGLLTAEPFDVRAYNERRLGANRVAMTVLASWAGANIVSDDEPRLVGFGKSLLVQGAFGLVLDATMFFVMQAINRPALEQASAPR